jgi:hypothetical protein
MTITVTCEICGKEFTSIRNSRKTCSPACRQRLHRGTAPRRAFQIYTSGPRQTQFDRAVIAFAKGWFEEIIRLTAQHLPHDGVVSALQWATEVDSQRIYRLLRDLEVNTDPDLEPDPESCSS